MKRILIIYNVKSSRAAQVRSKVIEPIRAKTGVMVGKYSLRATSLEENAKRLAEMIVDGDEVVVAGGDGTVAVALNGAIHSGSDIELLALPYGNFDDMARAFREEGGKKWYPLEIKVNGEHFRYAGGYFSMGMFAESTKIFDEKGEREELQRRGGGLVYSIVKLAEWYFWRREKRVLPVGKVNGVEWSGRLTDYLAVNTGTVAKVMKTKGYGTEKKRFYRSMGELKGFWGLMWYMMRSIWRRMPGEETDGETIEFEAPVTIAVQTDGEYCKLSGVERIEIKKAKKGVKVAKMD